MKFPKEAVAIELQESDGATSLIRITTPVGAIDLIGEVTFAGSTLRIERAHVDGPGVGKFGRAGLNAIGAQLLVVANVDDIIVQGSDPTTGRNPSRPPKTIRFPR